MLHDVHQLVANFARLLFSLSELPAVAGNDECSESEVKYWFVQL